MSRRKLLAIVAVVAILVGAVAAWQILRPRTIGEVLAMDHLRPGSEISVQGTVTAIGRENTSVGPRAYLQLDGNSFCGGPAAWTGNLLVDPNGTYRIGESYQTTLHVQDFSIEGEPADWVPELACPFPALYRAIGVVIDAVSKVRDLPLVYNRTDAAGWSEYHIQVQNATGFDPNLMPVDLLKVLPLHMNRGPIDSANAWRDLATGFYLLMSSALGPNAQGFSIADRMASLSASTSLNGTLRFVDANSNGRVDSGDHIDVRLPPTGSPNRWDPYLLRVGNWSANASFNGSGVHAILVGPTGPLEALPGIGSTSSLAFRSADDPTNGDHTREFGTALRTRDELSKR